MLCGRDFCGDLRRFCGGFLELLYGVRAAVCVLLFVDYFKGQVSAGFLCDVSGRVDFGRAVLGERREFYLGVFCGVYGFGLFAAGGGFRVEGERDLRGSMDVDVGI